MKTAIATVCLSGGLDEKLLAIANAGLTSIRHGPARPGHLTPHDDDADASREDRAP